MIRLKKIWKNRNKILTGIFYSLFPNEYVESIAKKRSTVCRKNVCGFYDSLGIMEATILKGKSACGGCGCNERIKTRSLSSWCYLKDIGLTPLWEAEMTEHEEELFKKKYGVPDEQ